MFAGVLVPVGFVAGVLSGIGLVAAVGAILWWAAGGVLVVVAGIGLSMALIVRGAVARVWRAWSGVHACSGFGV